MRQALIGEQVLDQHQVGQFGKVAELLQRGVGQTNRTLYVQRFQLWQGSQLAEPVVAKLTVAEGQFTQAAEFQQLRHVGIGNSAAGQPQSGQRGNRGELFQVESLGRSSIAGQIDADEHPCRVEFEVAAQLAQMLDRRQGFGVGRRCRVGYGAQLVFGPRCRGRDRSVGRTPGGQRDAEDQESETANVSCQGSGPYVGEGLRRTEFNFGR